MEAWKATRSAQEKEEEEEEHHDGENHVS